MLALKRYWSRERLPSQQRAGFPYDFSQWSTNFFIVTFIRAGTRASARSTRIFNDGYRGPGRFTFDKTGDDVNRVLL